MIRKKIKRTPVVPNVTASIKASGGIGDQAYLQSGEHYPDRSTLAPLILQPDVRYSVAGSGRVVDNACPELTDGCWYRITADSPGLTETNKISTALTGTDADGNTISLFEIDSTPGSPTYGRLTVRENVPVDTRVTYLFVATLSAGGSHEIRLSYDTGCATISEVPEILFDNNPRALYDPIAGEQWFYLHPSLSQSYPVIWKWMSFHDGQWGDLESTLFDWAVGPDGDGIKIDRRRMQDRLILKCVAEVTIDGAQIFLERGVTHTRRMPAFTYDMVGIGELPEDVSEISPTGWIRIAGEILADVSEFLPEWLDAAGNVIATGLQPVIPLSRLGADMELDFRVTDRGGWKALVNDAGAFILDGTSLILTR